MYFCLFSEQGCSVEITPCFNLEMERRVQQKAREKLHHATQELLNYSTEEDNPLSTNVADRGQNEERGAQHRKSKQLIQRKRQIIKNEVAEAYSNPLYRKLLLKNFKELARKRKKKIMSVLKKKSRSPDKEERAQELLKKLPLQILRKSFSLGQGNTDLNFLSKLIMPNTIPE